MHTTFVLPAYAGMIPHNALRLNRTLRAPRVCGDDPEALVGSRVQSVVLPAYAGMILVFSMVAREPLECSPRMRG